MAALDKPDIDEVRFEYKNHAGKIGTRRVLPLEIWFGSTAFHPKEQWLLKAFDLDKEADRDFAIQDINGWRPA